MTNKEAITILVKEVEGIPSDVWDEQSDKFADAVHLAIKALEERPQGECIEVKHRLNLLIGVLYTNHLISESDLKYIEDSIKKLMKGGAE